MSLMGTISSQGSREFVGTFRFEVVRKLGAGGIGWVYEARDRALKSKVAIKTLQRLSAVELLRFKNEFRLLQGIHHPNLVQLGELFEEDGLWFFTMELVDGEDLLSYVMAPRRAANARRNQRRALRQRARPGQRALGRRASSPWPGFDEVRLRRALRQLADGLYTLHRAGRVHCDIKPQNLMVCDERVVLLDFGLVSEIQPWNAHSEQLDFVTGTPAYMAPEQARGLPATAASDWYAVGVMLYKALTGSLPFEGSGNALLRTKLTTDPEPPSRRARALGHDVQIPADLEALCLQLLQRDPDHRPPGGRVLAKLVGGSTAVIDLAALAAPSADIEAALVGRERELNALRAGFHRCRGGHTTISFVHGRAGMGKSALIDHFARELRDRDGALVLRSRCYERETVPYKAFDGVIDELVGFLDELCAPAQPSIGRGSGPIPHPTRPNSIGADDTDYSDAAADAAIAAELRGLLASEIDVLARLFPVLGLTLSGDAIGNAGDDDRLPALPTSRHETVDLSPTARAQPDDAVDASALRRRAFAALRRLFACLSKRWPVVIIIEDLQWGDSDSAGLFAELLARPHLANLMLVASYRHSDRDAAPVAALRHSAERALDPRSRHQLAVEPLSDADGHRLALSIWEQLERYRVRAGDGPARGRAMAQAATREAGGSPLFIVEIMRHLATTRAPLDSLGQAGAITLDQVINERRAKLDPSQRTLLDVIAVAGRPLPQAVALSAAGLSGAESNAMTALRAAHLVRTSGASLDSDVEIYHDRVRDAVLAHLSQDALRGHHGWLAETLDDWGCEDGEVLANHRRGAGQLERAADHAKHAAEQAEHALAFARAARMYRLILDIQPSSASERCALLVKLAEALSHAERGAEAASAYLDAAAVAHSGEAGSHHQQRALDYRRLAAELLLRSGMIERGVEVLDEVLRESGLSGAKSAAGTLAALVWRRLQLRVRGLRYQPRAPEDIPLARRLRVDVCWSAAIGLAAVDYVRAADFAVRCLLMALDEGYEVRIATALVLETCYLATTGEAAAPRALELARQAKDIAARTGDTKAIAFATFAPGAVSLLTGRWRVAYEHLERSDQVLQAHGVGISWEAAMERMHRYEALLYLGDWGKLHESTLAAVHDAEERGDQYTLAGLAGFAVYGYLWHDQLASAREVLRRGAIKWDSNGYPLQRFVQLYSQVQLHLYEGRGVAAWERLTDDLDALERSVLTRSQLLKVELDLLRARCALAVATTGAADARRHVRAAERVLARLRRQRVSWSLPLCLLIEAGLVWLRGDRERAVGLLAEAAQRLDRADMFLFAASAKRQQGRLIGGYEGARLIDDADAAMSARGAANPAAIANMLVPGFGPDDHRR
ncbi:MAG: hypothetical protein Tsb0020_16720 [Haliangiales bacterium]